MSSLIRFSPKGLYCEKGGFYIDPWKPVDKAVITHAHSDHARPGHSAYLCHTDSVALLKHRLSPDLKIQGLAFGKTIVINGVELSMHPAGHIIGSAQIRVRDKSECWVVSGDYKLDRDTLLDEFEPVQCDHFVTESTFGLPVFQWREQNDIFKEINQWWESNSKAGKPSIISAYSLGKAQRVIQSVDHSIGPVLTHGAVQAINDVLIADGFPIRKTRLLDSAPVDEIQRSLIVCPPGATDSSWSSKIKNHELAFASGWMNLRGARRRRSVEKGFVLSDHADWHGLNKAVEATGAENVYVTHGYTDTFAAWLREKGIKAKTVKTMYTGESIENENAEQ